jgi:hypothetical protein
MDHNQHDQQGIYTLHHVAEQAENPDVDPQVVLQHLQSTMHNVEVMQQQIAAMAEATSNTTPSSSLQETLQALAENQIRQQEYQLQVQDILAQLAQRGPNVPIPNALTTKFKGDPNGMSLNQFMSQLNTVFSRHPKSFKTDIDKINLALQSLDGTPAEFFAPYVIGSAQDTAGYLSSWSTFTSLLNDLYGNHLHADDVNNRLIRLRQTGTISEYIAKFQPLASQSGWNEVALLARFKDGLSSDVKSLLTAQMHNLKTLRDAQAAASTAYQNHLSRARDQRFGSRTQHSNNSWSRRSPATAPTTPATASSSNDMDLDTVRVKHITAEEKQRRRDNKLCLYCGGKNHFAGACPIKTARLAAVSFKDVSFASDSENESA